MISDKEHQEKNNLTDIANRGIFTNPDLFDAYQSLPYMWSKLSSSMFTHICREVRYENGGIRDGYNYLSNITPITIDVVLRKLRSAAYSEGKKIENDRKNYKAQLVAIHDGNIFYMWQHGKYMIFFMEREIRSWLYYNKDGCVIPRTMIKILDRAQGMIDDMIGFHDINGSRYTIIEIESSFGVFLNKMIDKMNPCIAEELPRWKKDMHINDYIDILMSELKKLKPFDGLTEALDYMERLPESVRDSLIQRIRKGGNMSSDMEKEIGTNSNNANLGKPPRKKRAKKAKKVKKDEDPSKRKAPKTVRYNKQLKPLEEGNDLARYYRAYLQRLVGTTNIRFEKLQTDYRVAVEIVDLLRTHNVSNKEFLNTWIEYFFEHKLKGDKVLKTKYTSLRVFQYTFDRFKEASYIHE